MKGPSHDSLLDREIALLVQHFGLRQVETAVAKLSARKDSPPTPGNQVVRQRPTGQPLIHTLRAIRDTDPVKHELLENFLRLLTVRKVLAEAQDVRFFARAIGAKHIDAKSRRDLIPVLMRILIELPTDRLLIELERAKDISEEQRQRGFSILADKLVGGD